MLKPESTPPGSGTAAGVLNRDEFRSHCDKYKTREAILANLR